MIDMLRNIYYHERSSVPCSRNVPGHSRDSFSSTVIMRMLRILLENGEMKKSNLCGRAGMNYKVCTRYIEFLTRLQWLETRKSSGRGLLLAIPSEGIENLRKLESKEGNMGESGLINSMSSTQNPPHDTSRLRPDDEIQKHSVTNTDHRLRHYESGVMTSAKVGSKTAGTSAKGSTGSRRRKKIVIIDDDENALFTYGSFLENDKSLKVLTFSDPRKALEYLTTHLNSTDLIILDIRMPGMSGLRVYQGVKALDPRANIIFLSSLDAAPELGDLLSNATLDNSRFMRKPVRRSDFIQAIQNAVS
jgi:CheY-like chemotaxis protein